MENSIRRFEGHSEPGAQVPVKNAAADARRLANPDRSVPEFGYEPAYMDKPEDRRANFLRYLGILRKHRWLVISVAGVVFSGGALLTFLTTPIYRSTATVQIDREAAKVLKVEGVDSVETNDPGFYPTQYELLRSRSLASRVVADLNLTENTPFLRSDAASGWRRLRQLAHKVLGGANDSAPAEAEDDTSMPAGAPAPDAFKLTGPADLNKDAVLGSERVSAQLSSAWTELRGSALNLLGTADAEQPSLEDFRSRQAIATDRVLDGLSVEPVGPSRVVRVAFESPDPAIAARVANAVAEAYIKTSLERRYDASSYARNFLQERLQEIKLKLEDSEKQLVQYAKDQELVSLDGNAGSLAQADLAKASAALADATTERLKAEQLWIQVKQTNGLGSAEILGSRAIEILREKRATFAGEYEEGRNVFKEAYPTMLKLRSQIDELDQQIKREVDLIKSSVAAKYLVAKKQEQSLQRHQEELKKNVLEFDMRNIQYKIIRRDVDTNLSLYDGLLNRYKEIGVAGGVGTNNVSIVDSARVAAEPFKPNTKRNLAVALGIGLLLGGLAAFGLEFFDDALKLAEDVESELGLPVLGVTPLEKALKRSRSVGDDPTSGMAEALRSLRTALQFSTDVGVPKSLLLTSPRPSEGKSTISLGLAKSFAQLGLRVLLIDADLRDPSLERELQFGHAPELVPVTGLTNYLTGAAGPPEVFQRTDYSNLFFLPTGPLPPNPAELLAGPKMPSLLRMAEEKFDLVIIDGPPVMGLADAPLLASVAAGTLLIVAANQSKRGVSKVALSRLQFARAHLVGAVLNKFDHRKAGFAYGYGYGYGDDYHYGYGRERALRIADDRAA